MIQIIYFARMVELEEGTGTEASDSEILEKLHFEDLEDCTRYEAATFELFWSHY